jgi:hypothetical protein
MAYSPERWLARAYHGLCRHDHERLVISYKQLFERFVRAHDQHCQAVALRGEGAKSSSFRTMRCMISSGVPLRR